MLSLDSVTIHSAIDIRGISLRRSPSQTEPQPHQPGLALALARLSTCVIVCSIVTLSFPPSINPTATAALM